MLKSGGKCDDVACGVHISLSYHYAAGPGRSIFSTFIYFILEPGKYTVPLPVIYSEAVRGVTQLK